MDERERPERAEDRRLIFRTLPSLLNSRKPLDRWEPFRRDSEEGNSIGEDVGSGESR
jgi:hypothetical protein